MPSEWAVAMIADNWRNIATLIGRVTACFHTQRAIGAHGEVARHWLERPQPTVVGGDNQSDICAFLAVPQCLNFELIRFAIFAYKFLRFHFTDQSDKV